MPCVKAVTVFSVAMTLLLVVALGLEPLSQAVLTNTIIATSYLLLALSQVFGMFYFLYHPVLGIGRPLLMLNSLLMMTFFIGCGGHHAHLAYDLVHGHAFFGTDWHSLALNYMQVVGAPGAVVMTILIMRVIWGAISNGEANGERHSS